MRTTLSLAALAIVALLLAVPVNSQAASLKLDGVHQEDSLVQAAHAKKKKAKKKKKKKKAMKKKKKKKAKKKKRRPAMKKK